MPDAEDDIMANLDYNRDVVGVDYDVGTHEVTEEQVIGFANAIGETNPMYLDKEFAAKSPHGTLIAPPAYYTSIRLESAPDAEVKFGTTGFNASQHCEFYEPMKVGDTISAKTQVSHVYAKTGRTGTMVFTVRRTTYSNQHGRDVMMVESSMVRRDMNQ